MRDYVEETETRVNWIREVLKSAHADGVVFGNSGGKDSVLVGILCRRAVENVTGVIMPCASKQNYGSDMSDALLAAKQFGIETLTVDLTQVKAVLLSELDEAIDISQPASTNINPRLRMATLYAIAQSKNCLVAGTGNASEIYMGYFTKWGDGAFDFNPIADLTATEVFEFLRCLGAPESIIGKAPSAGLYEGQTDETEMGVTYAEIDRYIKIGGDVDEAAKKIARSHEMTEHKRRGLLFFPSVP